MSFKSKNLGKGTQVLNTSSNPSKREDFGMFLNGPKLTTKKTVLNKTVIGENADGVDIVKV